MSCTDGAYRVLIKNPLQPQNARIFFSKGVPSLNVEADATRRAGPRMLGESEFLVFGVGRWASLVQGNLFLIRPDGSWVFSSKARTDVRFDNLVARKPTETEVRRSQAAPVPAQKPATGTTTAHS